MCLLTIILGFSPRFPVMILNNRDEYVQRATSALTHLGREAGERAGLLCALDTSIPGGGTWMGLNTTTGAFACVTNSYECASEAQDLAASADGMRHVHLVGAPGFDVAAWAAQVLATDGPPDSSSHLRPLLAFKADKSRGTIVADYLTKSSRRDNDAQPWRHYLPSNVVASPPHCVACADRPMDPTDLFFDGYNLVCGNLADLARGIAGADMVYTTNRQLPVPTSRRRAGTEPLARPHSSPSWQGRLDASLREQLAMPLAMPAAGAPPHVTTVGNTFLDNPVEPKSQFLTATVRTALEALRSGPLEDAAADRLVAALAPCLCAQSGCTITPEQAADLFVMDPLRGLGPEGYAAAVRERLVERAATLPVIPTALSDSAATKGELIERLVADVVAGRGQRQKACREEETACHRDVFTRLCRGRPELGDSDAVFQTRTQSIIIIEAQDHSNASHSDSNNSGNSGVGPPALTAHYWLRESEAHDRHGPWSRMSVPFAAGE